MWKGQEAYDLAPARTVVELHSRLGAQGGSAPRLCDDWPQWRRRTATRLRRFGSGVPANETVRSQGGEHECVAELPPPRHTQGNAYARDSPALAAPGSFSLIWRLSVSDNSSVGALARSPEEAPSCSVTPLRRHLRPELPPLRERDQSVAGTVRVNMCRPHAVRGHMTWDRRRGQL